MTVWDTGLKRFITIGNVKIIPPHLSVLEKYSVYG